MYKIFDFQNLIIKRPVMITSVLTSDTMHNTSLDLNPNPDPNLVYPNLYRGQRGNSNKSIMGMGMAWVTNL